MTSINTIAIFFSLYGQREYETNYKTCCRVAVGDETYCRVTVGDVGPLDQKPSDNDVGFRVQITEAAVKSAAGS